MTDRTQVNMCPSCGGMMRFDPESGHLKCDYCDTLTTIERAEVEIVEHGLKGVLEEGVHSWSDDDVKSISCKNCGAELVFEAHNSAKFCNYCGSSHISEHQLEKTIPPGYLVPFKITEKEAGTRFVEWLKKRWFAPSDLKSSYKNDRLKGTYVPYWTYDTDSRSYYTAQRGDYYYVTKTRTVNGKTETYQERHTRWTNVSGHYNRFFDDVLVCASSKIDGTVLHKLDGFGLGELEIYKPEYLSGFFAERYSVPLDTGWVEGKRMIESMLESDIRHRIGGDTIRMLNIQSDYHAVTFKHILLPVWMSSYLYKSKSYIFMINGQNGEVEGTYPKSALKIALAVLAVVVIVFVLYVFISTQTGGGPVTY